MALGDDDIKRWIQNDERFEGRSFGKGLYLRYRPTDKTPVWRFRYRFAGKQRVMNIGSYTNFSRPEAIKIAKELSAKVQLGIEVAAEKRDRIATAVARIESEKNAMTVAKLADEYFERMIIGRWKHPNIVRARIENDIKPNIGKLKVEEVRPRDIDDMLQMIVKRGAPTIANDVLRWCKRMFNFAIKRHVIDFNPACAFDLTDAGGKEQSRTRWLTQDEIARLFKAMRDALGRFTPANYYAVKLLLLLAVRKEELIAAQWSEFDLESSVWKLPESRSKTGQGILIPLPDPALETLEELKKLSCGSKYVFPARKMQTRMIPHIDTNTLNAAIAKHIRPLMPDVPHFTIHDFRRTARTHLSALGTPPHVAERCLNHKLKGIVAVYDHHDYFEERKIALHNWAKLISSLDKK